MSASFPDRLSFIACHAGERQRIDTTLLGDHWVHCVLAAIAAGLAAGLPLATIARRLRTAAGTEGRFSLHVRDDGVTFVRDDLKAPLGTIEPALRFLRGARAARRILVVGSISDYMHASTRSGSHQRRLIYADVARQALEVADHVVFVGVHASKCLDARGSGAAERLQAFYSVRAARAYLARLFAPGDLVLLKGTHRQDRLVDIVGIAREPAAPDAAATADRPPVRAGRACDWLVIGLGNAAERFAGTRHNVGHAVLDALARAAGVSWRPDRHGSVAWIERDGRTALCVKPAGEINGCGAVVMALLQDAGIAPNAVLVAHDDVQLEVGRVRVRAGGGHGGHRGVQSVLDAFDSDAIHRVKVGVGGPPERSRLAEFVVAPFAPEEQGAVARACADAAARIEALLGGVPSAAPRRAAQAGAQRSSDLTST